jgi:hypothetical protein
VALIAQLIIAISALLVTTTGIELEVLPNGGDGQPTEDLDNDLQQSIRIYLAMGRRAK